MLLKCKKCGFENQLGTIYCHGCGEKLDVAEVDPVAMEESRIEEEEQGSWRGTIISWVLFFIVLGILVILAYNGFSTDQAPVIPSRSLQTEQKVIALADQIQTGSGSYELSTMDMTRLFRQCVLTEDCEKDFSTYAIRGVVFEGTGKKLTAHVHTNLANRKVVFSITGEVKKGDQDDPIRIKVDEIKFGRLPVKFVQDTVFEKFKPVFTCDVVKDLFAKADKAKFDGGKLKIEFKGESKPTPSKTQKMPRKKRNPSKDKE